MGKTYRRGDGKGRYDDDRQGSRKGKHPSHANNRKNGGMRILNEPVDVDDDDFFDDGVEISDEIELNIKRGRF